MVQLTGGDRTDVLAAAREAFPGLTWQHAEIPDQGLDHHVAVLSGATGVPGSAGATTAEPLTVVARLATAPGVVGRADVEAGVLAAVDHRAPAAVPRALATDGDSLTLARHIPGEPLSDRVWGLLDDAHRRTIAAHLAATLDAIHGIDAAGIDGHDGLGGIGTAESLLAGVGASWFPIKHSTLAKTVDEHVLPILDAREAELTGTIMAEAEATFITDPVAPRLIHGDLHETHLRWDDTAGRGSLGVIDFSDMTLADPAIDVAHLAGISPDLHARVVSDLAAADADLERRAAIYSRWDAVFLLADHVVTGRTPETTARALFGRALESMGR
ncbi:phosphotransferase family protein [Corynebacterium sp. NPDC060344]|uniref:phosphotransferase family protein n=1 Tax=Corynebacterium sp. NPDC060344 TaxID=3347101 RepID=UPI0036651FDA